MNNKSLKIICCAFGLALIASLPLDTAGSKQPELGLSSISQQARLNLASVPVQEAKPPVSVAEAVTPASSEEEKPEYSEKDLELLACLIYQEAGSDACCDGCRRRVADVALNRVESEYFPGTLEEVLTQPNQYGTFSQTGVIWPERAKTDAESHAVERAYRIAEEVLTGHHSGVYGDGYIWQAEFEQGTYGFWCCGIYYGKGAYQ